MLLLTLSAVGLVGSLTEAIYEVSGDFATLLQMEGKKEFKSSKPQI